MVTRNTKAKSYLGAPEPYDAVTDYWTAYVANRVTKDDQSYTFFWLKWSNFQLFTVPQEPGDFSYTQARGPPLNKILHTSLQNLCKCLKFFKFDILTAEISILL